MRKKLTCLFLALVMIMSTGLVSLGASASSGALTLNKSRIGIKVGDVELLTASSSGLTESNVTWTSSNNNVATVNSGMVTGKSLGKAEIKATTSDGRSATCYVHVAKKGIDVSAWQYSINWNEVKKSGVDFAIIRTGYGGEAWDEQTDKYFESNLSGAKANGIKVGVYHFSYATTVDMAVQEARMCLNILNGRNLDYPVYIDIEDNSQLSLPNDLLCDIVTTFCNIIQSAGYRAGIYSSPYVYENKLTSPKLDSYEKWVAHWGVDTPRYYKPFGVWQFGSGPISGIGGDVDLDYSYKDYTSNGNSVSNPSIPDTPPTTDPSDIYMMCDTTMPYHFGTNKDYYYKVSTNSATVPTATSSNPSAVSVSYSKRVADGYIFKISNVGNGTARITTSVGDTSVFFTAYGTGSSTTDNISMKCDTTAPYHFGTNKDYYYKITTNSTTTPTAVSSNPSAVSASYSKRVADGYIFKISNVGNGTARITTSVGDTSVFFTAYGTGSSTPDNISMKCDTTAPYHFGTNKDYYYKITTNSTTTPTAVSSNPSAVSVSYSKRVSDGYIFKISNVGNGSALITTKAGNASVAFTAYGKKSSGGTVISDTTYPFTMQRGKTYQFKFTLNGTTAEPSFTTGNGSVIKTSSVKKVGSSYYYTISAVGKGCTGVYTTLPGQSPVRHCVVTVA